MLYTPVFNANGLKLKKWIENPQKPKGGIEKNPAYQSATFTHLFRFCISERVGVHVYGQQQLII